MVRWIVQRHNSGRGYVHRNIGGTILPCISANQVCRWYKLRRNAEKAAFELNVAEEVKDGRRAA